MERKTSVLENERGLVSNAITSGPKQCNKISGLVLASMLTVITGCSAAQPKEIQKQGISLTPEKAPETARKSEESRIEKNVQKQQEVKIVKEEPVEKFEAAEDREEEQNPLLAIFGSTFTGWNKTHRGEK